MVSPSPIPRRLRPLTTPRLQANINPLLIPSLAPRIPILLLLLYHQRPSTTMATATMNQTTSLPYKSIDNLLPPRRILLTRPTLREIPW